MIPGPTEMVEHLCSLLVVFVMVLPGFALPSVIKVERQVGANKWVSAEEHTSGFVWKIVWCSGWDRMFGVWGLSFGCIGVVYYA
ncbi:hypothetical protein CEXT_743561 [Caerostris extrusa]|uniref:Uncharacterized protein n=1 Tax=Caerostris extrusa TaxID=172846 RepID=A0AAV4MBZ0_CAEEX|nr:hypothetical protein CEXT_743561 [Caerostris extrusa]